MCIAPRFGWRTAARSHWVATSAAAPKATSRAPGTTRFISAVVRSARRLRPGAGSKRKRRGGPLKNAQLTEADPQHVGFVYRPHGEEGERRAQQVLMCLPPDQFFARCLAHVPPPGLQSVRAYGLYAHSQRERLNRARVQLAQAPVEPPAPLTPQAFLARFAHIAAALHCPHCGLALIPIPLPRYATCPPNLLH